MMRLGSIQNVLSKCLLSVALCLCYLATTTTAARLPVVVITGASRGIGLAATKQLAATLAYDVVVACRSKERAEAALASLPPQHRARVELVELDLADFGSINKFCQQWGKTRKIDALCLNAGVQFTDAKEVPRTRQGFEETIGVNHIGHWLLANLLLENVKQGGGGRIVWTASGVHNPEEPGGNVGSKAGLGEMEGLRAGFLPPISMVNGQEKYDGDKAYKDSKLCNVITTIEMARRLQKDGSSVTCNCFNPGLIPTTGLFRGLNPVFVAVFTVLTRYVFKVAVSEEVGGERLVRMISDPVVGKTTGGYFSANSTSSFNSFGPLTASTEATDETVGRRLWDLTERVVLKAAQK
jgi:protochlorophyllide reductase